MTPPNPFKPTFGVAPPTLVGREEPLGRLRVAMEAGPTHPDSAMLISSPRGSGKTVLLGAMHEIARDNGWIVVHATASRNATFAGQLADKMIRAAQARRKPGSRRRVETAHLGALGINVGMGLAPRETHEELPNLRMFTAMEALADLADETKAGVLVTIDEFHNANVDGAREFAHCLQELAKLESRPILFAGAGLPLMEQTVLSDPGMTFFQRIARTIIEPLSELDAQRAIASPIRDAGLTIEAHALIDASAATSGYPFMVQLVGYHSWERAADLTSGITRSDVADGIALANHSMELQVLRPVWRDLSDGDREVLVAMSRVDETEVRQRDIALLLGKKSNFVSTYIDRLVDAGVVVRHPMGRAGFVHEAMRRWLTDQHSGILTAPDTAPAPPETLRDRITQAHEDNPDATHKAIADSVGAHPSYVGRVRREL